ncbi:hypothetical protein F5888DRAFT_1639463 [Russula emetica]|nr:hypothetical protein F5888DRAFT_1639463 [Russula emetica]
MAHEFNVFVHTPTFGVSCQESVKRNVKQASLDQHLNLLNADKPFRWVVCQADSLHRTPPASIRRVLDDFPKTLDETFDRTLRGIDEEKRLFRIPMPQCYYLAPIAEEEEGCSSPEAELPSPLSPLSPSGGCLCLASVLPRHRHTRPQCILCVSSLQGHSSSPTHSTLPTHPGPTQTVRAHEYARSRGGSAPAILSVLSQLHVDKCWLIASLGGAQEARALARELEAEGVSTRYCKVWEGAGVPAAWVLHADIPHEEFDSLLGPLLVPEHYPSPESPLASSPLSLPPPSPIISAFGQDNVKQSSRTGWSCARASAFTISKDGITAEDEEGVLLALEQRHRVRHLRLVLPVWNLQKLVMAIDGEFPILEYLIVDSSPKYGTVLELPETLQAPLLRHLALRGFSCPIQSRLLPTALKSLVIHFTFPVSNRVVGRQLTHAPITTHITLPNLRFLWFKGVSAYLEVVQLMFSVPHLAQFMDTTENFRFDNAMIKFKGKEIHVSSAAQICNAISQVFSAVERLTLRHEVHGQSSEEHNDVDRIEWRNLLRLAT